MRLTFRGYNDVPLLRMDAEQTEVIAKLAAYEDTGFEPDEIDFCLGGAISPQEAMERYEANKKRYDEWVAWKQAEEQGRLVILPCKVGNTVHFIFRGKVYSGLILHINLYKGFKTQSITIDVKYSVRGHVLICAEEIGKTVFLSREEAEAALKGESKDV